MEPQSRWSFVTERIIYARNSCLYVYIYIYEQNGHIGVGKRAHMPVYVQVQVDRFLLIKLLLYSWGSLFGVSNPFPLSNTLFLSQQENSQLSWHPYLVL